MTDQVLTDEEKGALIDGISAGEVDVDGDSSSPMESVRDFVVGPRSRIVTRSYPRLKLLNEHMATRLSKQTDQLLGVETQVAFGSTYSCSLSEYIDRLNGLALVIEFSCTPLDGCGLIYLESDMMSYLVESFYGGVGNEPLRQNEQFFTAGEISVASHFVNALLDTLASTWQSTIEITPEQVSTKQSTDIVEGVENTDSVICSDFSITLAEQPGKFSLVWPVSTVAPIVPVFEGQKRERNPSEDARWERSIRSRVTDAQVNISTRVGNANITLGQVASLTAGDIVDIESPRTARIFAGEVPIIEGSFGIHDGFNAIETRTWISAASTEESISNV